MPGLVCDWFVFWMQDLCAICTDFIISELWTSNFLAYQVLKILVLPVCVIEIHSMYLCYVNSEFPDAFRCLRRGKIMAYMENE